MSCQSIRRILCMVLLGLAFLVISCSDRSTGPGDTGIPIFDWDIEALSFTATSTWGIDRDHVFAVGNSGMILYHNGAHWSALENDTFGPGHGFLAVWGISEDKVFVVGGQGIILHDIRRPLL
jgi:photosystem II stability/assembly factor-like uncharacterized protein